MRPDELSLSDVLRHSSEMRAHLGPEALSPERLGSLGKLAEACVAAVPATGTVTGREVGGGQLGSGLLLR